METVNIQSSWVLLVVGLSTVFVVLWLVILTGDVLIALVNRFFPEEEKPAAVVAVQTVETGVAEAIAKAVQIVSGGKSKVKKIEKK